MKKTFFITLLFFVCSFGIYAQATLSSYAGTWKMTPININHPFSKITIENSTNTLTLKFKKAVAKSATARINPSTDRMETYIDGKGYYLVLGAQSNTLSLFELESNNKVGDFLK